MRKNFLGYWEALMVGKLKDSTKEFSNLIDFIEECWIRKVVRIYFKRSSSIEISQDVINFFQEIFESKKFTLEIESSQNEGSFGQIILNFTSVKFPDFSSKIKLPQKEDGGKHA